MPTNSCTPAGVIATRYSWFLTSLGMPTFMRQTIPAGDLLGAELRPQSLRKLSTNDMKSGAHASFGDSFGWGCRSASV